MKIFTCTKFEGLNPIGTAAVIIAETIDEAIEHMNNKLKADRLKQEREMTKDDLIEISLEHSGAIILNNGDY